MPITAARYGSADSQPAWTMSICAPALRIEGNHNTKPYTPMLQQKNCSARMITLGERNASA
ncbi:hypothetical protein D3C81_2202520 [compost metagenome]